MEMKETFVLKFVLIESSCALKNTFQNHSVVIAFIIFFGFDKLLQLKKL